MTKRVGHWGWIALAPLFASGCADERESGTGGITGVSATVTAGGDTTGGGETSVSGNEGDTGKLDLPPGSSEGPSNDESSGECASVDEQADVGKQPADIIFVVDNSGSMDFETAAVQANMNSFSSQIILANIDARVILLSNYPSGSNGICIDLPLGLGMCPAEDTNPPGYTHVNINVDSTNGLELLLAEFPNFAPGVMRPNASKHIVIVTDDNSDLGAADFTNMFNALDPANVGFKFHGIVADANPGFSCFQEPPHPCCLTAAAAGTVYIELINNTGGVFGSLCEQMFQPIFDELATAVVSGATLSCEFEIPPPPDGETFDADKVNVEFDDGNGGTLDIGRVDSVAECMNVEDGWYYDNPADPTLIVVCPQTCDKIQGFDNAKISIQFGCETVIAPPIG